MDSPQKLNENRVITPVVDGNRVRIEVPVVSKLVDMNKVNVEVPVPAKLLLPSAVTASYTDHAQQLVQNYGNFKKSGTPMRFMRYKNGSWVNFEKNAMDVMISGFVSGKPVIEVEMEGLKGLVDFYRMLEIDFNTGKERSISWIDENGKCFFPSAFVDTDDLVTTGYESPKLEIQIKFAENKNNLDEESKQTGKRKRVDENAKESSSSNVKEQRVAAANEINSSRWPRTKLLKGHESVYQVAKRVLGARAMVTSIHQCTRNGPLEKARLEVFQTNVEIIKRVRGGNANVVYAWCGASAENVEIILRHGFGTPGTVGRGAHGIGVYLSPLGSPGNSLMLSKVDAYGEKHIILCQVILGNLEKVEVESQEQPSSFDFDAGVDDLANPKWYVVWSAHMNTRIIPECVVSCRSGQGNHAILISKLCRSVPPPKAQQLQTLCNSYQRGELAKDAFNRQLRAVVGDDELLRSTIEELRG